MTHTITIETKNAADFELLKELAQRLGFPTSENHFNTANTDATAAFKQLQKRFPARKISYHADFNKVIDEIND